MSTKTNNIIFLTGNEHKHREVQSVLKDVNVIMQNVELLEIQGTDDEIIRHKAIKAAKIIDLPFIVEDSSLEYDALNGLPGPYIKWFLKSIGLSGLVNMLAAYENKKARAICNIAYHDGKELHVFKGVINGTIVPEAGTSNFGFDNIFMPDGHNQTFGQMVPEIKNSISHRRLALNQLNQKLKF